MRPRAGAIRPTPRSTRSSRSASSCRATRPTSRWSLDVARDARAADPAARRRHLAMRPDGGRRAGRRCLQVPARGRGLRQGARRGDGAARRRARPAQRLAEAARPLVSGRRVDLGAVHAGRHGGQQFLRQPLDPLRQHGAQRRRDRRHAGRRRSGRASARRGPRTCRRQCARIADKVAALAFDERDEIETRCGPRCCAGSVATTSTSSSRSRSGPTRSTIR